MENHRATSRVFSTNLTIRSIFLILLEHLQQTHRLFRVMHLQNIGTYSPNAFLSLLSFMSLSLTKCCKMYTCTTTLKSLNKSQQSKDAADSSQALATEHPPRLMQRLIKSPPCTSDTGNRKVAVPCFPPLHHGAQQVTGMEGHWQKPKYDIGCKKHGGNPHRDVKEMESHLFPSRSYQYIDIGLRLLMPWVLGPSNHSSKWT